MRFVDVGGVLKGNRTLLNRDATQRVLVTVEMALALMLLGDRLFKLFVVAVTEADTPTVSGAHMLLLRNPSNQTESTTLGCIAPIAATLCAGCGPKRLVSTRKLSDGQRVAQLLFH